MVTTRATTWGGKWRKPVPPTGHIDNICFEDGLVECVETLV